jgi:hypothetical protein
MKKIEVLESNVEVIVCGETYDAILSNSTPDDDGLVKVDVLFEGGYTERIAVPMDNIFFKGRDSMTKYLNGENAIAA